MKTKLLIWISTLLAVAFISLATAEKAEAQTRIYGHMEGRYIPRLHNGLHLVVRAQYYVRLVLTQTVGTSITVSGFCQAKDYTASPSELEIPFYVTIPANSLSTDWVLVHSQEENFDPAGIMVQGYSPTSWNGAFIIIQ